MNVATALMLATLTDRRDFGDDWLLERKFDGERCVAWREGAAVRLESRTGDDKHPAEVVREQPVERRTLGQQERC